MVFKLVWKLKEKYWMKSLLMRKLLDIHVYKKKKICRDALSQEWMVFFIFLFNLLLLKEDYKLII